MRLCRVTILGILAASLCACATTRLYPVCQFAGAVSGDEFDVFANSVNQTLAVVGAADHSALLASRRYVTVRTLPWRHRALAYLWPDIGCLGGYADSSSRAKYASCRDYITASLIRGEPGVVETEVLCFDPDDCAAMQRVPHDGQDADAVIYCNGQ